MAVNPLYVEALQKLQHHSPEGLGIPLSTCSAAGVSDDDLTALRDQGYVEVLDDGDEPTLTITTAGQDLLRP